MAVMKKAVMAVMNRQVKVKAVINVNLIKLPNFATLGSAAPGLEVHRGRTDGQTHS